MRLSSSTFILVLGMAWGPVASASGPADPLLKLVPADSGMTLALENLRDHAREVSGSRLFQELRGQPVAQAWLASDPFRKIEQSSKDIEQALGVSIATLRDDLLGDAVVLALQPAPTGQPDQARGLLLVKPRDRSLVDRLLKPLNEAQSRRGELARLEPRTMGEVHYWARRFKAAGRLSEFYVQLDDGTFAWSNSESMIQGVIDRKVKGGPNLGDSPEFREIRRGLPDRAIASLFFHPGLLRAAINNSSRPVEDRGEAMLSRYLGAMTRVGVAIDWKDGLTLHSHETLDPQKLDPWLKRWLTRPASPLTLPDHLPPSTVALLSANLDLRDIGEGFWELIPEAERPSLDNLRLSLQGILLGRDPWTEILPRLGPGSLFYLDVEPVPEILPRFPVVGVVEWSDVPGSESLAPPLNNALRTAFAIYALDQKQEAAHLRVESRTIGDSKVTLLTNGVRALIAFRIDKNRIVLGNSPEAVARFGTGPPPSAILEIRARNFPEAETFAIVDLDRLVVEIKTLRGLIARSLANHSNRPVASADHDLGDLIALAGLFKAVTFTSTSSKDASAIHRTIGLIAR